MAHDKDMLFIGLIVSLVLVVPLSLRQEDAVTIFLTQATLLPAMFLTQTAGPMLSWAMVLAMVSELVFFPLARGALRGLLPLVVLLLTVAQEFRPGGGGRIAN